MVNFLTFIIMLYHNIKSGWEYRKFQQNKYFKRRLKKMAPGFKYFYGDWKGDIIQQPKWYVLVNEFYIYKNVSTTKFDTNHRWKYHLRRVDIKRETVEILKEYGISTRL